MCRPSAPSSAARKSAQCMWPWLSAMAPPTETGSSEAVKLNGRTTSHAPARRRPSDAPTLRSTRGGAVLRLAAGGPRVAGGAGAVVILGPPGGRDLAAQRRIESRALHRDVAQDRHHVDDEGLALGAVQRFLPAAVEEAQQVATEIDVAGRPSVRRGGLEDAGAHLLERGQ